MGLKPIAHYLAIALEKMTTTRYQPTSPCRTCCHWLRLANGEEDCDRGRLLRQPTCRGYEREPGSDDELGDDDALDNQ
jgi:hypothetical protein